MDGDDVWILFFGWVPGMHLRFVEEIGEKGRERKRERKETRRDRDHVVSKEPNQSGDKRE